MLLFIIDKDIYSKSLNTILTAPLKNRDIWFSYFKKIIILFKSSILPMIYFFYFDS